MKGFYTFKRCWSLLVVTIFAFASSFGQTVAKIGTTEYTTLQAAVEEAQAGDVIDILQDFTLTTVTESIGGTATTKYNVDINKSVTINGNGHTITASAGKRALALSGSGNDIVIKDLTVVNNGAASAVVIWDDLTCTLDNTTVDGTNYGEGYNQPVMIGNNISRATLNITNGSVIKTNDAGTAHYAIIAWSPADITVSNSTLKGWANVYLKSDAGGSTVNISDSQLQSTGLSGNTNNFAMFVTESDNNTFTLTDDTITNSAVSGTYNTILSFAGQTGNTVTFNGNTTYTNNDNEYANIVQKGDIEDNTISFDATAVQNFQTQITVLEAQEVTAGVENTITTLGFLSEVYYYWYASGVEDGGKYDLAEPFKNGWLDNGEYIRLQKNVTLSEDLTWALSNASFTMTFGEYSVTKGNYAIKLKEGVSVTTDKQTDIFAAANSEYKIVETQSGSNYVYTVTQKTYVAQIGTTKYESLAAAVAAVPTDGTETTITMLANDTISTNAGVIIAAGKNIVLELNGKAIVQNAPDASAGYLIRNNGTLTITDNTDTNNDGTGTGRLETNVTTPWVYSTADPGGYATNLISNYGTLTINSGYLVNNGMGSACYAVDNYQSGSVTVNGGALVTAKSSAIRMFYNNGGSLAVTSGIIGSENSYMGVQVQGISTNGVNVNLTGGTFNGDYAVYAGGGTNWATSNISISGGTYNGYVGFTGTLTNVSVSDGFFNAWCGSWGDVKFISGGRFADSVDEAFCAEGYIPATLDVETNKYTVKLGSYVAQIGSTKYETLAEAIAAVPTDGTETTITMLADEAVEAGVTIDAGKNVVLELAGHTISGNTSSTTTYALITNRGTLTIQDSTDVNLDGTGNGLITTYISDPDQGDVPGYASNTITNNGTLTVKSGKIVNNGSGYACYAIDNQTNGTAYTPVLNIEGGRMEQMNAYTYAVRMFCNSTTNANTVNISGGVITGGYGLWLQTPNNKANVANLNISGGTLESRDGAALYVGGTKADNSNISINITDGTIGGTGVIIQGPLTGTYGSLSISGGYIENVQCGANVESFISGGIYNNPVQDAYAAEFYAPCDYNNDTYGVTLLEANERDYIFIDGDEGYEQYGITAPTEVKSATYRRSFDSQRVDKYQAWFLPFDYTITAEDVEKFDFYKIHMIANAPQAGVNEPSDQIWIYLNAIGEGTVLYANKPYVYVPKEEIDSYNFVTEGATLKAPLTTSPLSVETAENTYSFYGTYAATTTTTEDQFYYLSINGGLSQGQQSGITVGPYRWILRVNSKNIIDYAPSIGFMVEDDVTGINAVGGEGLNGVTYFTVDGKRVSKPGKGVYIVRSADGSTRKVLFK